MWWCEALIEDCTRGRERGQAHSHENTVFCLPNANISWSMFAIPIFVVRRLEKLRRDFLCREIRGEFKYHMVSWEEIYLVLRRDLGFGYQEVRGFQQRFVRKASKG